MKHIFVSIAALLLALCWLVIPACKKDATPYSNQYRWQMNGRVLEYGSGKPLAHALVRLRLCESEFLGPVSCYTLLTDTTDAQGKYSFDYTSEDPFLYLDAIADQYYPMGQEVLLNRGQEKGFDLTLIAHSKMLLTFYNSRDTAVNFSYDVDSPDYPNYFQFISLGPFQDTTRIFNMGGNATRRIRYYLYLNPNDTLKQRFKDTVVCPPHDILVKEIQF